MLDARPTLSAIGCFCIGTNQVDLAHAGKRGIAVFNAPYSNTRSVVELVICDIICLMRRIPAHTHHIKHGLWDKSASGSHEVRGKTLGIIGYGNIGSQLSVLAEALGMRVVFYDIEEKLALGNAHRCDTLNELLEQSDAVTLHVDGRKSNTGFFGEDQFAHMKQDAIFINLSRGFVADLGALKQHLDSGHLSGAAVDVFPVEPKKSGDPFETSLANEDNMILTPHIGGSTLEAQESIGHFVSQRLEDYWFKGSTSLSVNLPQINLGECKGVCVSPICTTIFLVCWLMSIMCSARRTSTFPSSRWQPKANLAMWSPTWLRRPAPPRLKHCATSKAPFACVSSADAAHPRLI